MPLFGNKQETNLHSCIEMVEDVIQSLGHDPDKSRLETRGEWPGWCVSKGSARVYILMHGRGEQNFIRVTAPIVHLDDGVDRLKLFRRLLALNAGEVFAAAFALDKDDVLLTTERSTEDLDRSEVLDLVKRVEDYAGHWGGELVREFGGRLAGDSAAPML